MGPPPLAPPRFPLPLPPGPFSQAVGAALQVAVVVILVDSIDWHWSLVHQKTSLNWICFLDTCFRDFSFTSNPYGGPSYRVASCTQQQLPRFQIGANMDRTIHIYLNTGENMDHTIHYFQDV